VTSAGPARDPNPATACDGAFVLDPDGNRVEAVWHG